MSASLAVQSNVGSELQLVIAKSAGSRPPMCPRCGHELRRLIRLTQVGKWGGTWAFVLKCSGCGREIDPPSPARLRLHHEFHDGMASWIREPIRSPSRVSEEPASRTPLAGGAA